MLAIRRIKSANYYNDYKYIYDLHILRVPWARLDNKVAVDIWNLIHLFYITLILYCHRINTAKKDIRYKTKLEQYIQLQIIVAQINTCFRKVFLPGIFFAFGICNITCSYFCVSYASSLFQNLENLFFFSCLIQSRIFLRSLVVCAVCWIRSQRFYSLN